jgi:branched-chain amino acid transport system ATP-binding protein
VREGRHIFGDLTVEENLIAAGNALAGAAARDRSEMVFGYFPRLRERRKQLAGYLSGGEQQMLAIGRAIVGQAAADPARRAVARPRAAGGAGHLRDHRAHQPRAGRRDAAGRAERARRAECRALRLHHGERRIVSTARPSKLLADPDVQRFYLGSGDEGEAHAASAT